MIENNETVSSGDLQSPTAYTSTTVSSGDISQGTQTVVPQDYTKIVDAINNVNATLVIIMFFIIFVWAEKHIKNAVRSFTGIGLK